MKDSITENNSQTVSNNIRSYLKKRRMCSTQNLALSCELSIEEIWPELKTLQQQGYIRISQKKCGDSCGSCSTNCGSTNADATAIIISLEKNGE